MIQAQVIVIHKTAPEFNYYNPCVQLNRGPQKITKLSKLEGGHLRGDRCDHSDVLQATTTSNSSKVSHTPIRSFIRSVPRLQYWNLHSASDKHCRRLAVRLQVSPLLIHNTAFSTIKLASMKHGWSNYAGWFGTPWQSHVTSHLVWAFARGYKVESFKHLAPLCNCSPSIFGAWGGDNTAHWTTFCSMRPWLYIYM